MVGNLGLLVPLESENRWTDLLAVLIATDPAAAAGVLGLRDVAGRELSVSREVRAGRQERVDLQIHVDGQLHTVLEAKVLSGLGHAQLARYDSAYRGAHAYLVAYPGRLVIDPGVGSRWHGVSWEQLFDSFAASRDVWVAGTAAAWLAYLDSALPHVEEDTK